MTLQECIDRLDANAGDFSACIASLPDELFLASIDAWTPRDVLAHLIGWNRLTVEGCALLAKGEVPTDWVDSSDDFAALNAVLVRTYPSRDRGALLAELATSLAELKRYLQALSPEEWEAGVAYGPHLITVQDSVQALSDDYANHREQVERWAEGRRNPPSHCQAGTAPVA